MEDTTKDSAQKTFRELINKWGGYIHYEMDKSFIEACDRLVKHYGRLGLDNKGTDSDSHKQTSEPE